MLGLELIGQDISEEQTELLTDRQAARDNKDFARADSLRDELMAQGIGVRDTNHGQIWFRQ